jgi:hypothetical protein
MAESFLRNRNRPFYREKTMTSYWAVLQSIRGTRGRDGDPLGSETAVSLAAYARSSGLANRPCDDCHRLGYIETGVTRLSMTGVPESLYTLAFAPLPQADSLRPTRPTSGVAVRRPSHKRSTAPPIIPTGHAGCGQSQRARDRRADNQSADGRIPHGRTTHSEGLTEPVVDHVTDMPTPTSA